MTPWSGASPGWVVLLPSEHRTSGSLCPCGAGRAGAASLVGGTDSDPGKPLGLSQNREDSIAVPGPARPRAPAAAPRSVHLRIDPVLLPLSPQQRSSSILGVCAVPRHGGWGAEEPRLMLVFWGTSVPGIFVERVVCEALVTQAGEVRCLRQGGWELARPHLPGAAAQSAALPELPWRPRPRHSGGA